MRKTLAGIIGSYIKISFQRSSKQEIENYQRSLLRHFLTAARRTSWGTSHRVELIQDMKTFQEMIPLSTYDDLQYEIEHCVQGQRDVLRPGRIPFFSKSSGTTAASKFIPITTAALQKNHYAVGKDVFAAYLQARDDSNLLAGKGLIMGGRLVPNPFDPREMNVGDVSAILQHRAPWYTKLFRKPSSKVSFMENFNDKLDAIIEETRHEDITFLAGVPSWLTLFLQRLVEKTGARDVFEVWPNLELFLRGGISIAPYTEQLKQLLPGDQVRYRQNYNASEGFFAFQDKPGRDDMVLAIHHHILYEFVPVAQMHEKQPATCVLGELKEGEKYEMVVTTDGGLWRYRIGDVIEVTSLEPLRIRVVGRTKSFLNMFGEELMIHTTDDAIQHVCTQLGIHVADYVATAVRDGDGGYHHWYIDSDACDEDNTLLCDRIAAMLDAYVQQHNSDYAAKRKGDLLMKSLRVTMVPSGTFHRYLASKGKTGGQHKMKRLWGNADDLYKEIEILAAVN